MVRDKQQSPQHKESQVARKAVVQPNPRLYPQFANRTENTGNEYEDSSTASTSSASVLNRSSSPDSSPTGSHAPSTQRMMHRGSNPALVKKKNQRPQPGTPHQNRAQASRLFAGSRHRDSNQKKRLKKKARPGVVVMREIRRLQQSTQLLIPKRSFCRLVREVTTKISNEATKLPRLGNAGILVQYRFQAQALHAIQEAAEFFLISLFEDVNLAALHGRRVTIMPKDFTLVLKLRNDRRYRSLEERHLTHVG